MADTEHEVHTAEDAEVDGAEIEEQQSEANDKAAPEVTGRDIAAKMGWSDKKDWRGDPSGWRDWPEFLEHTASETKSLRRTVKRVEETMRRMTSAQEAAMDRALSAQRRQLEASFDQAVEDGDKAAAKEARDSLRDLEKQAVKTEATKDDDVEAFVARHSWFQAHPRATDLAIAETVKLAKEGRPVPEQLEAAEAKVRKAFPELFDDEKPGKKPAPGVNEPGTRTSSLRPRARGFDDLPSDAKQHQAKLDADFKKRGFPGGYPKDEYAKDFWEDRDKRVA